MDAEGRYCLGCARTLDDIARWSEMTDAERSLVLSLIDARRIAQPVSTQRAIANGDAPGR
jgi:uncharacterized protein